MKSPDPIPRPTRVPNTADDDSTLVTSAPRYKAGGERQGRVDDKEGKAGA